MSESHGEGSAPTRDLEETRDELAQASIALNTAYDRLQELRSSLRSFTAQRDRLSGRTRQGTRPPSTESMGPNHSAIVFSDSDEESEFELLRESLPSRLLELTSLTSRWGHQHARLNAPRQVTTAESRTDASTGWSATSSSEEPRSIYQHPRRRRPPPPAAAPPSRDSGTHPPGNASPARRSILEAHLRQLRHASNPAEPTTTLGRRVAQRAAAARAAATGSGADTAAPPDRVIHSTLPLGLDPRPSPPSFGFGSTSPHSIESRAAAHLRHSLLPNPPSGDRPSPGSRTGTTPSGHPRFSDRLEHRPRTARSNSLTALTRPALAPPSLQNNAVEISTQVPLSSRLGQLRATTPTPLSEEEATRFNFGADLASANYRVRRRLNARGEEQVFNINWNELMSDGERDENDPVAWMRPPRQPTRMRLDRPRAQPEPETDDTVVHESGQPSSRETRPVGRDGSAQRRRGWARLDADGDEISTEDEASFERARAESRLPRTRNWTRSGTAWAAGRGSTVAVLDFVHHNSRSSTTGHRDPNTSLGVDTGETVHHRQGNRSPTRILDSLFHSMDSMAYISPLPMSPEDKRAHLQPPRNPKEVQVVMTGRMAGR